MIGEACLFNPYANDLSLLTFLIGPFDKVWCFRLPRGSGEVLVDARGPPGFQSHAGGDHCRMPSTPTGFHNKAWGRRDNGAPQERPLL
jgi:hypothetical protein